MLLLRDENLPGFAVEPEPGRWEQQGVKTDRAESKVNNQRHQVLLHAAGLQ